MTDSSGSKLMEQVKIPFDETLARALTTNKRTCRKRSISPHNQPICCSEILMIFVMVVLCSITVAQHFSNSKSTSKLFSRLLTSRSSIITDNRFIRDIKESALSRIDKTNSLLSRSICVGSFNNRLLMPKIPEITLRESRKNRRINADLSEMPSFMRLSSLTPLTCS